MSKVLGSWSGIRKYLEKEMLTDSSNPIVRMFAVLDRRVGKIKISY